MAALPKPALQQLFLAVWSQLGHDLNTIMRIAWLPFLVFGSVAALSAQTTSSWRLTWSDEFNGPAGTPPDPAKWNYDLGGGGWGNGEIETYTNSPNNVFQDGQGNLVIRAIRDSAGRDHDEPQS